MPSSGNSSIVIIGAGVVGLATALTLQREGHPVVLTDPSGPAQAASANGPAVLGMATADPPALQWPAAWRTASQPLTWLIRRIGAHRPRCFATLAAMRAALCRQGIAAWKTFLANDPAGDLVQWTGALALFADEKRWHEALPAFHHLQRLGGRAEILPREKIAAGLPDLGQRFVHGIALPDIGQITDLRRFITLLVQRFVENGGRLETMAATGFRFDERGRLLQVQGENTVLAAGRAVITAGQWSPPLAQQLGTAVPLMADGNRHLLVDDQNLKLPHPLFLGDAGIIVGPTPHGLQLVGRATSNDALSARLSSLLPILQDDRIPPLFRRGGPVLTAATADGLPVIAPSSAPDVFFAFGHGDLHLTLAAITGRLVADMIADRPSSIDRRALGLRRFCPEPSA